MTEPTAKRDAATELAERIVAYIVSPDSTEPDDSTGSPTAVIAGMIRSLAAQKDEEIAAIRGSFDSAAAVLKERYQRQCDELAAEKLAEGRREGLEEERKRTDAEMTQVFGSDGFLCGVLHGQAGPFVGGCRSHVRFMDAYRCADCTASFHRDCIRDHFKQEQSAALLNPSDEGE